MKRKFVSEEELLRLRKVEMVAKQILEPMLTASDGGKMWCAFSRHNHENMSEKRAIRLVNKFKYLTDLKETKPKEVTKRA